ncbi:MAG: hypothetical protein IJD21_06090 [Oscillospiraceae bacterium]|nr:hypothetical protein [Oscillospiraceae bacterium]
MEIERKFWLDRFPEDLPEKKHLETWQGYLYTDPNEVRIRRSLNVITGEEYFRLCVKSDGTLKRHEVETPLSKEQFEELCLLLEEGKPLIHKDQRVYDLGGGLELECSVVDGGVFSYAEVEFATEQQADAWTPHPALGRETTHEAGIRMKRYWHDRDALKR